MNLADANRLLEPGYTDLESGYRRLDDGQMHVAAWTGIGVGPLQLPRNT